MLFHLRRTSRHSKRQNTKRKMAIRLPSTLCYNVRRLSIHPRLPFTETETDDVALDKMRTYRPRILVHGPAGMGQAWLGPAILHHLEGFHVQTLDLGTLMGDSSRVSPAQLLCSCCILTTPDCRVSSGTIVCRSQTSPTFGHFHSLTFAMGVCHLGYCTKHHPGIT